MSDRLPTLTVSEAGPPERGDAARNRALLLEAARRLVDQRGAEAVDLRGDLLAQRVHVGRARQPTLRVAWSCSAQLREGTLESTQLEAPRLLHLAVFT